MKSNSLKKILILICAVAIAAGAVLYFLKTIVTPPVATEVSNVHIQSIEDDINELTESGTMTYNDSLYVLISDKIAVFSDEGFLDVSEKDDATKAFILKYVPVINSRCQTRFDSPGWDDTNFPEWRQRINELLAVTLSDGERVVQGIHQANLRGKISVMDDYQAAKRVAASRSFHTVERAGSDIRLADEYLQKPYIGHSNLANDLGMVRERIGADHFRHVSAMVGRLADFRLISPAEFGQRKDAADNALAEYDNCKNMYRSAARDITELKDKAREYIEDAEEYYEAHAPIQVNLNGSWVPSESPDSRYAAYMSSSNWNQPGSNATMSFDISGRTSFTFYIDSYAEGNYDYVMVGYPNSVPSVSSNYENTKGWQKPGTSLGNYKTVSFSGLDSGRTYRIYVVYHKDDSNNYYDDRGYVLLPK